MSFIYNGYKPIPVVTDKLISTDSAAVSPQNSSDMYLVVPNRKW